jgi:hypothetical protein
MPRSAEANLPPTNEGYGTKEYWWVGTTSSENQLILLVS